MSDIETFLRDGAITGRDPNAAGVQTTGPGASHAVTRPGRGGLSGRRVLWLVAAAILLASVGFGAGLRLGETRAPAAPPVTASASDPAAGQEPVADVARALLPSTVHIQAGNGAGSGVVYDPDGLILTAAHVVMDSDEVLVRLADGTRLEGLVLGRDTDRDVAVVQVDATGLDAAQLATGIPIEVGQLAVAIGSPFGLEDTVTSGVVSAVGRSLPTGIGVIEAIQTDAPINPGNSGGPLADRHGRVIGINVATRAQGAGVSFAVPIDVVMQSAERIQRGEAPPAVAFLGVSGTDAPSAQSGAMVTEIHPDSPAERAGVREGDLITAIDARRVPGMMELAAAIRSRAPGDQVTLTVERDGRTIEITAELATRR